ncbi:MAG: glycosyltransferase family 2 protein [Thermodesulfobacteriota bacterium]
MSEYTVDYSIIIPVYYNEGSLAKTFDILKKEVIGRNPDLTAEIIFIDDGSGDNSFQEMTELKNAAPQLVRLIKFTRNFGQLQAIMAGFKLARGKCVINISADLQDPPELINEMIYYHFQEHREIVICTREARDESFFRRVTSQLFYSIMKRLSFPNMPQKGFDFVLLSDKVKQVILNSRESNAFFQGQILWTGYSIHFIPYVRRRREIGKSRWTFGKKIKYLIDGVMSYSYFPIRMMSVIGAITALIGFGYAFVIFTAWLFAGGSVKGWAPLMIAILVLSGVQMLMIGIVGEYLWRTLDQVRERQPYIIDRIIE